MSVATVSARVHTMTPEDELIGSLTRERVTLLVRYAGAQAVEDIGEAHGWLSYALGMGVPHSAFIKVAMAYEQRERLEEGDLEFWFEMDNTEANRELLKQRADTAIEFEVARLTVILCNRLDIQ